MGVLLVPVASPLHDPAAVKEVWGRYLSLLKGVVDSVADSLVTRPEELRNLPRADAYVVAVLTGGSEELVLEVARRFGVPIALVAHDTQNSLAATLEAASEVAREGGVAKVFLLREGVEEELSPFLKACKAVSRLRGSKLLMIGEPSPWLIYSSHQVAAAESLLGISTVKVSVEELVELTKGIDRSAAEGVARSVIASSDGLSGVSRNDVVEAAKLYLAIKELVRRVGADLITIRCFDLLKYGVTACLALALLNDEGYVASCEGDVPALVSMALLRYVSGAPAFMGNVDWVSGEEVLIAHCTAPTKILKSFRLRTHFESGISVAIEGFLRRGEEVTIVKADLSRGVLRVVKGEVVNEAPVSERVCRTQYVVKVGKRASKLVSDPLGNHYALTTGWWGEELRYVAEVLRLKYELIE